MKKYLDEEVTVIEDTVTLEERLMDDYGDEIVRLVYTYVKNEAIAEELAQEIFIKCFRALPTFNGKSSYKTWLYRIAINHCKDFNKSWYAKSVAASGFKEDEFEIGVVVEDEVVQRDLHIKIRNAVNALKDKQRVVIHLHYFESLTSKEIAMLLKVNENTVKSRIRKGKAELEKTLKGLL